MTLDITKTVYIIETMENYISQVRPELEIRHLLDIGCEWGEEQKSCKL